MAVTTEQIANALRITKPNTTVNEQLTRYQKVAEAFVSRIAPDAPSDIKDEATIRMSTYLYDGPPAARGDAFANAWRNSGAGSLTAPWVVRRAPRVASDGSVVEAG